MQEFPLGDEAAAKPRVADTASIDPHAREVATDESAGVERVVPKMRASEVAGYENAIEERGVGKGGVLEAHVGKCAVLILSVHDLPTVYALGHEELVSILVGSL